MQKKVARLPTSRPNKFRWQARYTILSILLVTCVVSFMDRMAISVAIPYIAIDFHLNPTAMGMVLGIFFASYALAQIPGGLLADRFGVRRVATAAMLWWSAFTAITGAATHLTQMLVARFCFGLGEGVFPTCAFKTIAVWFPKQERATANAVMLASGSIGAALAPLVVVQIVSVLGWRAVFYSLCLPGVLVSLLFWLFISDKPAQSRHISPGELVELQESGVATGAAPQAPVSFFAILRQQTVLSYCVIYFLFDIAYWGFSNWLPTYLVKARGFSMLQMGVAASLPQLAGVAGSVLGGWISDRHFSDNRRVPIVAAQLLSALFLYLTFAARSAPMVVLCQTLAGFCLNGFFTAFWAIPMNTVSPQSMGVTSGVINTAGQTAAFVSPLLVGFLVGVGGGNFALTFVLLVVSVLASCATVLAIPGRLHPQPAIDLKLQ